MTAYLKEQLRESLDVVDTCLGCIYDGKTHMYRALAGQLRLLLCDTQRRTDNSLIRRVFPNLRIGAVELIGWSENHAGPIRMEQMEGGTNRIAQMPIEISAYSNGLVVADLIIDNERLVPVGDWSAQRLTFHPTKLRKH